MAKKASNKKPLTKTEYYDAIQNYLIDEHGYEAEDFSRKDIQNCLDAIVNVAVAHCKEGIMIPNMGKLILHYKKPTKDRMGVNPATGEQIKIKAKPAAWVTKFRPNKALKDACMEVAPKIKKKKAAKKKTKRK